MIRTVGWFGAALIVAGLTWPAAADTIKVHTHGKHHVQTHRGQNHEAAGQTDDENGTPSWLTLGAGGSGSGRSNNYVTGTFDQSSAVQGTFSGFRGQERTVPQAGVPGAPVVTH
jgi:hypothetical protein